MTATSRINAFMRAASAQLRSNDSVIAQRMSCALALEQLDAPRLPPAKTPVCALLADLLIDRQEDLLQRLALCAEDLHWRRAGFGKLPYDIDRKLAVRNYWSRMACFSGPIFASAFCFRPMVCIIPIIGTPQKNCTSSLLVLRAGLWTTLNPRQVLLALSFFTDPFSPITW
jgi:hypothetical protein